MVLLLLFSCGDGGADPDGRIPLVDAENYTYTGRLDVPSSPTAAGTDLVFDWAGLSRDIQCHALDPGADIDNVALLVFPSLSQDEVEAGLATDALQQADMGGYISFVNDEEATDTTLSALSFFGVDPEIEAEYQEGSGTWMLMFTTGTTPGVGARMIQFIEPRAEETSTRVDIGEGCGMLDFSVDIASAEPVPVLAEGPWLVDWGGLEQDGRDLDFPEGSVDRVVVARYQDLGPAELEADFLDLELMADDLWTVEVEAGSSADLSQGLDAEGQPFPGFLDGGTWILALSCTRCSNPAPLFLGVVDPQGLAR